MQRKFPGRNGTRSVPAHVPTLRVGTTVVSASYLVLLLSSGLLFADQPPATPGSPAPTEPKLETPVPDESALPLPRQAPRPLPVAPIVEEPAPAPHEQPAGAAPLVTPPQFREEAAPMPREQPPPPARFWMPDAARDSSLPDVGSLHRAIETLRMEREAMLSEKTDLITSQDLRTADRGDANLRKRVTELIAKAAQQAKKERELASESPQKGADAEVGKAEGKGNVPRSVPHSPSSIQPSAPNALPQTSQSAHPSPALKQLDPQKTSLGAISATLTDEPVDPLGLAQSLFRAGDYTAALNAYRKLDKEEQKPEDRITIQYMMACCLRKLGRLNEASVLYREAANSPGNDFLMENAQWYLRTLKERRELEAQLDEVRQRRQALKSRKP